MMAIATTLRPALRWIPALVIGALFACSDQAGPTIDDPVAFAKGGRWATDTRATDVDAGTLPDGPVSTCSLAGSDPTLPPCMLRHLADAPPLEAYSTSFTAVQGRWTYFVVHYLEQADDGTITKRPFMTVTIPWDAKFLGDDGKWMKNGDSVTVSVNLDPEYFHVEFGPHGSRMRPAATLWFSLQYADMSQFDEGSATVYYRPDENTPWSSLNSEFHRIGGYLFTVMYHFSGYAVAW